MVTSAEPRVATRLESWVAVLVMTQIMADGYRTVFCSKTSSTTPSVM